MIASISSILVALCVISILVIRHELSRWPHKVNHAREPTGREVFAALNQELLLRLSDASTNTSQEFHTETEIDSERLSHWQEELKHLAVRCGDYQVLLKQISDRYWPAPPSEYTQALEIAHQNVLKTHKSSQKALEKKPALPIKAVLDNTSAGLGETFDIIVSSGNIQPVDTIEVNAVQLD